MSGVRKTGDWARLRAELGAAPRRMKRAISRATHQEAERLRGAIVRGLTSQSPGGADLKPPAETTLAARRMDGAGGSKALIVRADLRNSVTVDVRGDEAFVGVPRRARSRDGESLVKIAEVHEFGSAPTVIPMTDKMRRFLFAMLREAGVPPRAGAGAGVVVTQIPARPFLRPTFERFKRGAQRRFLTRVAAEARLGAPS